MDAIGRKREERDALGLQLDREELVELIQQAVTKDGEVEVFEGVYLARLSALRDKVTASLSLLCVSLLREVKRCSSGDKRFQYDPFNYLLTTMELPRISQVIDASKGKPYLSFRLVLDPNGLPN